tara:strand:+ start:778 stop:1005 length:228 start_codon:yes stop_codon:yes gene_type:complete
MSQKHTDTNLLKKGIKYLVFSLPLLFLCPYTFTLSFINKETVFFYIFFITGLIFGFFAFYFLYRGFRFLLAALFD